MLINNFKNSGSAEGAVNYVLSMYDHDGKLRSVAPKILDGDPQLTKDICKYFCENFSHKTVSGVMSFRDNEKPTDKQKMEAIEEFKKTFLGNMREKVNCLFVEHNDKGNCEIHYVINRVELFNINDLFDLSQSGRHFNPFPPGDGTKKLMKLFSEKLNQKFDFKEVKTDPLRQKFTQDEMKCMNKERHGIKNLKEKIKISEALEDMVKLGMLKNRKQLVEFLKEEGYKIERLSDDYLSIKNPVEGGRNIRFKGGIFAEHNGLDYNEVKELAKNKPRKSLEETEQKINKLVEKRAEYNTKRFKVKQTTKNELKDKANSSPGPSGSGGSVAPTKPTEAPKTAIQPLNAPVPKVAQPKAEKEPTSSPDVPMGVAVNHGLASAQANYQNALAKLRNAKSYIERIKLMQEVAKAKKALEDAENADLENKNKTRLKI